MNTDTPAEPASGFPAEILDTLPAHLRQRTTPTGDGSVRLDGEFVLCWLHHAVRGHENPVLDAAVHVGNTLGKPVLVYQGLGGRHRYNNDRHHTFIMEGARDLQAELASRGIACAFHLPRDPSAPGPIRSLATRSCLVVTEDFPAPPMPRWTRRLAVRTGRTTLLVDGSCLMPIRSLDKRYTRAFKFRDAAKGVWRSQITARWRDINPEVKPFDTHAGTLGFERVDLASADIQERCAACEIDHGVPPVGRIRGGSTAGYQRWDTFRKQHLSRYDRRRNDAADMEAVSGLSPYLHHGHVSPFRLAREAHEHGGKGADKFLDELLVWRELAHNFCLHTPERELETLSALPDWAQRTLAEHQNDTREAVYSWETLARGTTGQGLWDAAQRSLVRNGELHNNLRMTWGKAIASWARSPKDALEKLMDLNHRYALDGSDPNSYGGLLWCLGQFDRPFSPERPVLGSIRERSVEDHADRLDPARYASAVDARDAYHHLRVAVVGGGVAGLTCARAVQEQGGEVTVFDRGRGPGGRMSTRPPGDGQGVPFDHGAPYLSVSDPRFGRYVRSWIEDGVCHTWRPARARWDGKTLSPAETDETLVVGVPAMSALCEQLATGLDLRCRAQVVAISPTETGWMLSIDNGEIAGPFDAVAIAMAPEQARRLTGPIGAFDNIGLSSIRSEPVWVGIYALQRLPDGLPDILETPSDESIEKLVRNERKPGRNDTDLACLSVYSRSEWAAERLDADKDRIAKELLRRTLDLITKATGHDTTTDHVLHARAHRWRFARPSEQIAEPCLFDRQAGLVVCGDGYGGSGVQSAFLSARAAAGRLLALRPLKTDTISTADTPSLFPAANP